MTYYITYIIGDPDKFILCKRKAQQPLEEVFRSESWTGYLDEGERTCRVKITKQRAKELMFLHNI